MKRNLGSIDRTLRLLSAAALALTTLWAPWPMTLRAALLAPMALYFVATALYGTCLGYRLMGLSTCPAKQSS